MQASDQIEPIFLVGEHVDCLDTVNKWCNAEILQVDKSQRQVYVHYTGFAQKYDEWIGFESKNEEGIRRIQK